MEEILNRINESLPDIDDKLAHGYYFWLEEFTRIIQPKVVVELGTFLGKSASHILKGLPEDSILVTVDRARVYNSILVENPDPRLKVVVGEDLSPEVWAEIPQDIDLLFIDTEHTFEQFQKELDLYSQKFAPTCYVVLDDINLYAMGGVWESINQPKYDLSEWHGSGFGLAIYTR